MSSSENSTCGPDASVVGWQKVASARLMHRTGSTGWEQRSSCSLPVSVHLLLDGDLLTGQGRLLYIAGEERFEFWLAEQ